MMTSNERIRRTYEHKETDRIPIVDDPWAGTIRRWEREGMPKGMDWRDYLDVDKAEGISVDTSFQFPEEILEQTDRYTIKTTRDGATIKEFNEEDSTPEHLGYRMDTQEKWLEAKERLVPDPNRIPWDYLKENYPKWKAEGRWIQAGFWFGFDITHSRIVGTETLLIALLDEPEWAMDMFNTQLDLNIALFDMIWDAGYRFDCMRWWDDMGYKKTPFFSNTVYRELLMPVHKRAVDWAHNKGIYAHLHSCGDIMPLLPDVVETGIDALNPIEIKAGMEIQPLKDTYGDRLVLHGGINAATMGDREIVLAEVDRSLPILAKNGGYIFSSDHSIPNNTSLATYKAILDKVKNFRG